METEMIIFTVFHVFSLGTEKIKENVWKVNF